MKLNKLFEDKTFYKSLFTIAVPIMLQNLINSFVNMLDTVMIGRLGTVEIAAVGLGNQVFFLLNMILFGISSGGGVFTAQFWGKKDIAGIRKNTGLCLALVLVVSTAFTIVCAAFPATIIGFYSKDPDVVRIGAEYLRAVTPCFIPFGISFVFTLVMRSIERVKLSMATTFIALFTNFILNWLLIFGIGPFPELGVVGAAIATVIARFIEMFILIGVSYARKYAFVGKMKELFGFDRAFVARFMVIAAPVILNEVLWSFGITTQNVIMARTHTDAIAAFNITNTVSMLVWVVFIGLGNGCAVLIGKKIGEGREDLARDYASRITLFAPLVAIGAGLLLLPLSALLPFVFNVNANVIRIMTGMFFVLVATYPFRAFNMSMIIGVCRSGGDTMFSIVMDVAFMWFLSLPLAAVASFAFHAPAWVVYMCFASEEPLKMSLGLWRLRSGKWLHDVTGDRVVTRNITQE
jgi:putative MATE family efflux protein